MEQTRLLHELLAGQDRQNELLEELVNLLVRRISSVRRSSGSGSRPIRGLPKDAGWLPNR